MQPAMIRASIDWFRALSSHLGALPARRVTWGLVSVFSAWVLLDVFVLKFTGGLAQSSFDTMVRARVHAAVADPRIVIVDIDEASLARMGKEFGRWPWPRDTLATVLDYIEAQQPAAIAWDLIFSDADHLSPGGDAAFNEAVKRSAHSHFSVVRLPKANDAVSQITAAALPGFWAGPQAPLPLEPGAKAATVALIAPAFPAVAAGRLGYNNGYVDQDGVLRRYRYAERLTDGSIIQSVPLSVLHAMKPAAAQTLLARAADHSGAPDELIAWRKHADAYPRIPFADVFARADGGRPLAAVPDFAGKVVIIGATAPSLHDIHPTPLSPMQAGVDSLATVLDNALNQRHIGELPRWLQALLAIGLCVGLALWVQFKSVASLAPALLVLPAALLSISYASLNGAPVFLDLYLAAGLALAFVAILRYWNMQRRNHWCSLPPSSPRASAAWLWRRHDGAWMDDSLDRLIDAVALHAPACRVVVCDANATWPAKLRWPELACFAAVVGPTEALQSARPALEQALRKLASQSSELVTLGLQPDRAKLATAIFMAWPIFQKTDENGS